MRGKKSRARSVTSHSRRLPTAYRCLTMAWHSCNAGGRGGCGGMWTSNGSTVALNGRPVDVASSSSSPPRVSDICRLCRPPSADVEVVSSCFGFLPQDTTRMRMHSVLRCKSAPCLY